MLEDVQSEKGYDSEDEAAGYLHSSKDLRCQSRL